MSKNAPTPGIRSLLVGYRFLGTVIAGGVVTGIVCVFASPSGQFALLGLLLSVSLGLSWECLSRLRRTDRGTGLLETPFFLAHDTAVFDKYRAISQGLLRISQQSDPIYRDVALERLAEVSEEVESVANGTLVFEGTETWRIVYEKLLRSAGLHLYRSVAWVKSANYWQDEPGRQSMKLNFELHDGGRLNVERIVIISDDLWPSDEPLPVERLHQWIREQHEHGIWVKLLRQSTIESEPELLADIGIYGSRAVGTQVLDHECRTIEFVLTFDFDEVRQAEDRWRRLSVYATAYRDLLDHFTLDE